MGLTLVEGQARAVAADAALRLLVPGADGADLAAAGVRPLQPLQPARRHARHVERRGARALRQRGRDLGDRAAAPRQLLAVPLGLLHEAGAVV